MIRNCIRDGTPLPKAIANAPELLLGEAFYYEAFGDLSTCRTNGGFIPWTAVQQYGELYCVDEFQIDCLHQVIRAMDNWIVDYNEKKNAPPKPKVKAK